MIGIAIDDRRKQRGLSQERLDRMRDVLAGFVDQGRLPGRVYGVGRRGRAHTEAIGQTAFADGQPMRRDTTFRIAWVTKPIVAPVHNERAIRSYQRVGFRRRPVGIMRRYGRGPDGGWHDGLLVDLLPEDLRQ